MSVQPFVGVFVTIRLNWFFSRLFDPIYARHGSDDCYRPVEDADRIGQIALSAVAPVKHMK